MNPLVAQFIDWFIQERGRSKRSADAYTWELERYTVYLQEKDVRVQEANKTVIRSYLSSMGSRSSSSRERTISCIKSFYSFLTREGFIPSNPADGISPPVKQKKVPNYLTKDDYLKLIGYTQSQIDGIKVSLAKIESRIIELTKFNQCFYESLMALFMMHGVTRDEIVTIMKADVNSQTGTISIGKRKIKLSSLQKPLLQKYIKSLDGNVLYLFPTQAGKKQFKTQLPTAVDLLRSLGFSKDDTDFDSLVSSLDCDSMMIAKRNHAIVLLLIGTGIRRIELVSLDKKDYDSKNATIIITRKGGDQQVVELSAEIIAAIDDYIQARSDKLSPLFLSSKQDRLSKEGLYLTIKKLFSSVGLKGSTHTLRHTFVTELVKQNVPLPIIQSLAGHKNADTTIKYTHLESSDRRKAVNKIKLSTRKPRQN
ncbi:MAG TPA: site-specific integrase [Caldisericia bacterium]|nr:site-specific integrase [Caldisericia bacterium]HPF48970.1 site-specific integrase [Caldisericia bacterium]HPI83166.1 site-specific integrase [Caldisericia bacterium]HPQ92393.1 site-specific integrase [Caldisericia bacterium]HRV74509.1 site-specific integrase [Caldisericia bacterium]